MKAAVAALGFVSMIFLSGCTDSGHGETAEAAIPDNTEISTDAIGSQSNLARTDEEIQSVFDRNRTQLHEAYQRYLSEQPTLRGKVHLRLTIEQNGAISECSVEWTDIPSEEFLADIVDSIKQFDFGSKANASRMTIIYPLTFLPAS
ncbi:MAG TPA: AgmX/PglI C-terminal domain-containing protein [Gammaproteobacteria bacterium]